MAITSNLPNPLIGGPCQAQASFTCTGEAQGERLNPLAMLSGSELPNTYTPMCRACADHLSDLYVMAAHS